MALVAERRNEVCVVPISYPLCYVIPEEVKQVDPEVYCYVVNEEKGQECLNCSGISLSIVED